MSSAIPPVESDALRHEVEDVLASVQFDKADQGWVEERLAAVSISFKGDLHGYCIQKFLSMEFDYSGTSQGTVELASPAIPRFGLYYRRQLHHTEPIALFLLSSLIKSCILRGYICRVILEEEQERPQCWSAEKLLQRWTSFVLSSDLADQSEQQSELIWNCCEIPFLKLKAVLDRYKFKGGGLLSKDKTPAILSRYPHAGYWLRTIETSSE